MSEEQEKKDGRVNTKGLRIVRTELFAEVAIYIYLRMRSRCGRVSSGQRCIYFFSFII